MAGTFVAEPPQPSVADLSTIPETPLYDHQLSLVSEHGSMDAVYGRCQAALKESIWREQQGVARPRLYADALDNVRLGERSRPADPRIVYFIGASRSSAAVMVSRLLLALYHHSHLFLVHVDLKAEPAVIDELQRLTREHPNIHLMQTRRLVQWGAWTMVLTMLDALHTVVTNGVDFDFLINLSDADVALRTNEEIIEFLRPYKGRQFVQVHQGSGEWLDKARNFTARHLVVECGGYGYVAINSSVIDLGGGPQCCFGRGGPTLYASCLRMNEKKLAFRSAIA